MTRHLYINVDDFTSEGDRYDHGDGTSFSNYNHLETTIRNIDCLYYSEEGNGSHSQRLNKDICYLGDFDWGKLFSVPTEQEILDSGAQQLWFVILRYSDHETFGRHDGRYAFPFVATERYKCEEWIDKNRDGIEKAFRDTWGMSFDSLTICCAPYLYNAPKNLGYDDPIFGYGNRK